MTVGVLAIDASLAGAARDWLDYVGAQLEAAHPAILQPAYGGEWKGRLLARKATSKSERRSIGKGELLSETERLVIAARVLDGIRRAPGTHALALSYRWSGRAQGPDEIAGYRPQRAMEHTLRALEYQGLRIAAASIDDGHAEHYSRAFAHFGIGPLEFVDSKGDRRIQAADLVAFAGHTARFGPNSRTFTHTAGWLDGWVAERLLRCDGNPYHPVDEP